MAGTTIDRPTARARVDVDAALITPLVYGVAVAALGLIRVAIGGGIDRMWAEDGSVFYEVANGGSLTLTYEGYLHVAPMLLALAVSWVPDQLMAGAYAFAWAVSTAAIATYIAAATRSQFRSGWSPLVFGAGLVLVPAVGAEAIGSIANMQWFLLVGATVAVLVESDTPALRRSGYAIIGLTALSSPLAVVLVPAALVRWRRDWLLSGVLVGGLAVQAAAVVLGNERQQSLGGPSQLWRLDTAAESFAAVAANGVVSISAPIGVLTSIGTIVVGLVGVGILRGGARRFLAGFALIAFGQWWLTWSLNGGAPRYAVVPAMAGLLGVLFALETLNRRAAVTATICIGLVWFGAFRLGEIRSSGPTWSDSVTEAECIDGIRLVAISPDAFVEQVEVHC